MHEKDDLDLLLDAALRSYANAGADSGLEERVLARIAEKRSGSTRLAWWPRRRWFQWAIAVPAAACILIALAAPWWRVITAQKNNAGRGAIATHNTQRPARLSTDIRPPVTSSRTDAAQGLPRAISPQPHQLRVARSTPLPKLDVFPTPQPLSAQEQALVVFATRVPPEQRKAVLNAQQQDNAPISIAAIKIAPLAPPDPDQDKN